VNTILKTRISWLMLLAPQPSRFAAVASDAAAPERPPRSACA
jgi:hypothetical protein